jgi:enoyl-CoA hydratase
MMSGAARAVAATPDTGAVSLHYSEDGRVATLLVDRERKLNALTLPMLIGIEDATRELNDSAAVVVLVRTAGPRVFCVGADINHFAGLAAAEMWRKWTATGHRAFAALAAVRQPTIAVIDGLALGGGFELALACDFRVISDAASVGLPEAGLGTVPGWGGTERLTELTGRSRVKDIVLTGRRLDAQEALAWGVADRAAPAEELDAEVEQLVSDLLRNGPIAMQLGKQLINAAADGAPSNILEALAGGLTAATADLAEGISAYREKRPPAFAGN